jgi:hypothetical protein
MNRFLGFAALTGLVLSAIAHVCALAGIDVGHWHLAGSLP